MEVHHHSQPFGFDCHQGKKKWTHYLWEFLMLFLAVFCGFLAENQREHMVEHQREKEYVRSFAEDLKQDTAQLRQIVAAMDERLLYKDSLLKELARPDILMNSSRAHFFFEKSRHFPDFIYTDRTIQQMKNSGGMRLLRNKAVSDSIVDYDSRVRTIFVAQSQINSHVLTIGSEKNKLFQLRLLDSVSGEADGRSIPLLTRNRSDVEEFYNNMWDQQKFFTWLRELDTELLARGTRLIAFIKKEYHLK
jgi:hypothetical protein